MAALKARQKATWEAGDFGEIARYSVPSAEEFMARLPLRPGLRVLDAACGTGNLAVIAARGGAIVHGLDLASNLVVQARARAADEGLFIEYTEGDAEAMPYPNASFDLVVSMYGVMFAPRPEVVAEELFRVTKPGGLVALANWTPEGFIGQMFEVFKAHLPPPPTGVPSPLLWGDESATRARLQEFSEVRCARRVARLRYPFSPAETVEFFRNYYGPTRRAFEMLPPSGQAALRRAMEELQAAGNVSPAPGQTEVHAEYLEVLARKG